MKGLLRPALFVLLVGAASAAGYLFGQRHPNEQAQLSISREAEHRMAQRLHQDFKTSFGGVRFDQPEYQNVVGTIHLFKDMDFAVYQDGAVKTVKVYEP